MADVKPDADAFRRLAMAAQVSAETLELSDVTRTLLFDVAAHLNAAANASQLTGAVVGGLSAEEREVLTGIRVAVVRDAKCAALSAQDVYVPMLALIDRLLLTTALDSAASAITGQSAEQLTARLDAEVEWTCPVQSNECEIRRKCTNKCGRSDPPRAATPAQQTVAMGPEQTAILVQALDYWNRDLTAPHMQIREIREALTGTVTS